MGIGKQFYTMLEVINNATTYMPKEGVGVELLLEHLCKR
jgi:hypothetical protein